MRAYRNLRIAPFSYLLDSPRGLPDHCGGPDFPDWDNEVLSRHCRRGDQPIDIAPQPIASEPRKIQGDFAYLGPVCHHFGHQVADFSMRIMPTKAAGFDGTFVYATRPGQWSSLVETPKFFRQIADYFDLADRLLILNEDAIFETVHVAPQAETIFGGPPPDDYLNSLERHFRSKLTAQLDGPKFVYVSRAKMVRGAFAGESVIEDFMRDCGAHVLYPEDETIEDLLRIYTGADFIVIPEGSAQHTLQFLGRQLNNVVIIKRGQSADYGVKFMTSRCRKLTYIDAVAGGISGNTKGRFRESGVSVLDTVRLLDGLRSSLPINPSFWSHEKYIAAVPGTVDRWIAEYMAAGKSLSGDVAAIISNETCALGIVLGEDAVRLLGRR